MLSSKLEMPKVELCVWLQCTAVEGSTVFSRFSGRCDQKRPMDSSHSPGEWRRRWWWSGSRRVVTLTLSPAQITVTDSSDHTWYVHTLIGLLQDTSVAACGGLSSRAQPLHVSLDLPLQGTRTGEASIHQFPLPIPSRFLWNFARTIFVSSWSCGDYRVIFIKKYYIYLPSD